MTYGIYGQKIKHILGSVDWHGKEHESLRHRALLSALLEHSSNSVVAALKSVKKLHEDKAYMRNACNRDINWIETGMYISELENLKRARREDKIKNGNADKIIKNIALEINRGNIRGAKQLECKIKLLSAKYNVKGIKFKHVLKHVGKRKRSMFK